MTNAAFYPIGTPGQPWGEAEKAAWLARQRRQRRYADDVLAAVERLRTRWDAIEYAQFDDPPERYRVFALRSRGWDDSLPLMLVTGGVHGYETSGVLGALRFAQLHADTFRGRANLVVVPCVSPWAWEHVQRWNRQADDPNRLFIENSPVPESAALLRFIAPMREQVRMHIDLHETTDSDESEFRRALAARDGKPFEPGSIPDGFYLCADRDAPEPAFQQAVLAAVAQVTHIAPADADGTIIGSPVVAPGVIEYPCAQWGLCAGITAARYRTTTEVYPDSPRATPEQCIAAQVAAVTAAVEFALAKNAP
ncbi:MAG: M14 family metallocarboxypeptidase [Proteobacteria bacterium]|nr:M14 family metallocarboxypeptidase [Pseudomonadota bacterium]